MTFIPTRSSNRRWIMLSLLIVLGLGRQTLAQTTSFTYQGKLSDNGSLANGSYDMQFKLFDTATVGTGTQQGSPVTLPTVQVTNGIFTVQLDFGAMVFRGADRFIEIAVKQTGGPSYTALAPRQPVSSTPYAIRSLNSTAADGLSGVCENCVTSTQIQSLQGSQITGTISVSSIPAGSTNYIQNATSPQASSNFNISGTGAATSFNATTSYQIGGGTVLSVPGLANTFGGVGAGQNNAAGANNTFFGTTAGQANTDGFRNSFFGKAAGVSNTTGSSNSFFGVLAGAVNTTGSSNSFFGDGAGFSNMTGQSNTFLGTNAGGHSTGGNDNTFVGYSAGGNNTGGPNFADGNFNTFVGNLAGYSNTTGGTNSLFGYQAGYLNTTGVANSVFGWQAGYSNTTTGNSFFGYQAGIGSTTGSGNAFFGQNAGNQNQSGGGNAFFGRGAGVTNTTGSNNTAIGMNADVGANNLTNANAIGAKAQVTQSNALVLGQINGTNGATSDTNVGIGTTAPLARLDVAINSSHILLGDAGCGGGFIGFGFGAPLGGCSNFSMVGNGTDTIINRPSGGIIALREANVTQLKIAAGGAVTITGTLTVLNVSSPGSSPLCYDATNRIAQCSSSLRYKTNVATYQPGLDVIKRLRPITFDWKAGGMHDLGFGAEEVAAVEPLLVTHNAQGQIEGVKYDRISAALVNAINEQQQQIAAQQKQIDELKVIKAENSELRAQIAAVLARLEQAEDQKNKQK